MEVRYSFGKNWLDFITHLDDEHVAEAQKSLQLLLGNERLDGSRFLDVGSGSGLFSLVARRLGARVHSFDYDLASVECTSALRTRFFPKDDQWLVEQGSVLDADYMAKLGVFDVVYSWGVLHHTGAMYDAMRSAAGRVAHGGLFAFALYRKTRLCWAWKIEKRWYAGAPPSAQRIADSTYINLMRLAFLLSGRDFNSYVSKYRIIRGMNYANNVRDWLGGYPYELILPGDADSLMKSIGFEQVRSNTRPYSTGLFGSGCDEFVYRRVRT